MPENKSSNKPGNGQKQVPNNGNYNVIKESPTYRIKTPPPKPPQK